MLKLASDCNGSPGQRKKTGNAKPIIGTGTVGNIRVVKTKLVSVFASKFSPDLDAETLSGYLKEKLGREITCQRIDTVHRRCGSFKITAECDEVNEMYDLELWPEGALVRRYYQGWSYRVKHCICCGEID